MTQTDRDDGAGTLASGWGFILLRKARAFIVRDFCQEISYRLAAFLSAGGILFQVTLFFFISRMIEGRAGDLMEKYDGSYFAFVVLGLAFFSIQSVGTNVFAANLRQGQMMGTLEAMLMTPTDPGMIVFLSALWSYIRTSVNMVIYLFFGALFGLALEDANIAATLVFLILGILAFSSVGILAACFILVFKRGNPITSLFSMASVLFGGVYFPVEVLPKWLQGLSRLLPITHLLTGVREAVINGRSITELVAPAGYLLAFTVLVAPVSILCLHQAVRKAKKEGSLAQY